MKENVIKNECVHEFEKTGLSFSAIPPLDHEVCIHCGEEKYQQDELPKGEETKLLCDICDSPMTKTGHEGSVIFKCTSCEQNWNFSKTPNGINSGCTILKHFWPSNMDENSKMYREQYIPARQKELKFRHDAIFYAGFTTKEEHKKHMKEIEDLFIEWYEQHPQKPWWKFW